MFFNRKRFPALTMFQLKDNVLYFTGKDFVAKMHLKETAVSCLLLPLSLTDFA